jgi:predicted O-methyltransferase YrrM
MLPEVLTESLARRVVVDASGAEIPLAGNVSLNEATLLYEVVRAIGPRDSIELGLAQGMSACAIAQAVHDNGVGTHHIVDPFQHRDWGGAGLASLERAGLAACTRFYEAFPEEVVPSFPRAQFAFIDASHLFDMTMLDFVLVDKRLDVGGVVAFHDSAMPSVSKALRYILTNRAYRVHEATPTGGVSSRASAASRVMRGIPGADQVVRPELLMPTPDLGVGRNRNIVVLEKVADDDRVPEFHAEF